MVNSLRRHIMQQVSGGGGLRWNYGVRYYNTESMVIVEDIDYAISEPFEVTTNFYYYGYATSKDCGCIKELDESLSQVDFWGGRGAWRNITKNANTVYMTICCAISDIENTAVAFFSSNNPFESFFYYRGDSFDDIFVDNNILNYYTWDAQPSLRLNVCTNIQMIPVTNQYVTFMTDSQFNISVYKSDGTYFDYWGGRYPNERSVNLTAEASYIRMNMPQNISQDCYIKYTNTGEYIWKGANVQ